MKYDRLSPLSTLGTILVFSGLVLYVIPFPPPEIVFGLGLFANHMLSSYMLYGLGSLLLYEELRESSGFGGAANVNLRRRHLVTGLTLCGIGLLGVLWFDALWPAIVIAVGLWAILAPRVMLVLTRP